MEQNITLRPVRLEDTPRIQRALNSRAVTRLLTDNVVFPYTLEDAVSYFEAISLNEEDGIAYTRAVCLENRLVGLVSATFFFDARHRSAELGYWLDGRFHGQGIIPAALRLFIPMLLKDREELVRLFCRIPGENKASARAAEKAGFMLEAVLKNALYLDETVMDEQIWAMLLEK